MKKLLYSIAIFGAMTIAITSCGKKEEEEKPQSGDKLPSKATYVWTGEGETSTWIRMFEYDSQNRLTKITSGSGNNMDTIWFEYGSGNTLNKQRWSEEDGGVREFRYSGDSVIITRIGNDDDSWSEVIIINSNKQLVRDAGGSTFEYNANGNVTKIDRKEDGVLNFSYSNAKSIFRHVNTQCWFMSWVFDAVYQSTGFMPSSHSWEGSTNTTTHTYTLDGEYVKTRTTSNVSTEVATYEYVDAK